MKLRAIGQTALRVSAVGLSLRTLVDNPELDKADAKRLLEEALYAGITLFDTADVYGFGDADRLLHEALGYKRHQTVISTKVGYDWHNRLLWEVSPQRPQRWDATFIQQACEESLKRLGTDYIDIFQLHHPTMRALESDSLFEALDMLVRQGKALHTGIVLMPAKEAEEAARIGMHDRQLRTVQTTYNLFQQEPVRSLFPVATKEKASILVTDPLVDTLFTDVALDTTNKAAYQEALRKRELFRFLARDTGRTLTQAAIQFCLTDKAVASVLTELTTRGSSAGTRIPPLEPNTTHQQLLEFAVASDLAPLTPEEIGEVQEIYEAEQKRIQEAEARQRRQRRNT